MSRHKTPSPSPFTITYHLFKLGSPQVSFWENLILGTILFGLIAYFPYVVDLSPLSLYFQTEQKTGFDEEGEINQAPGEGPHALPQALALGRSLYALSCLQHVLQWNAIAQLVLFVVVVQIPGYVSGGKMTYVDLGWPIGLVLISLNCWFLSSAAHNAYPELEEVIGPVLVHEASTGGDAWVRKAVMCGAMLFHGGRLALVSVPSFFFVSLIRTPHTHSLSHLRSSLRQCTRISRQGALYLFGKKTHWTYVFRHDLPRYDFAKMRWIEMVQLYTYIMLSLLYALLSVSISVLRYLLLSLFLTCSSHSLYFQHVALSLSPRTLTLSLSHAHAS